MTTRRPRLLALDIARSTALLGMACYHFTFDLQMFGLVPEGFAVSGWLYWMARVIASSFLGMVGIGLWLAHGQGINWPGYWRRLAKVAAAAALVTIGTRIALPDYYIFFGILHCIVVTSLLALPFLRLPALVTLAAAAAVIWASYVFPDPAFNGPMIRFLGLHTEPTMTVDFEPLLPWFAPVLIGLGLARLLDGFGFWETLGRWPATPLRRTLAWPGQHSLIVYLIHQPVLFGAVWCYAEFFR
jgi:uncharacterized membrane protein